jgi:hypothetical protein
MDASGGVSQVCFDAVHALQHGYKQLYQVLLYVHDKEFQGFVTCRCNGLKADFGLFCQNHLNKIVTLTVGEKKTARGMFAEYVGELSKTVVTIPEYDKQLTSLLFARGNEVYTSKDVAKTKV